ncbi:hypothetical protein FV232_26990 [Methylobacterium sp. WL30]|nr:hypothetical protein FV225_28120 [Methylobacterium sp. WL93]TXN42946.1 hypothetical protein FV227_28420 [Methylobacterium sp. WL119]TXN61518.1 hypothetical protein FV232_26990 [Methylobacterium sp. WL30]
MGLVLLRHSGLELVRPLHQRQLAASIRTALHIADRDAIAAFVLDAGTVFAPHNPFARTSVGAQRQVWTGYQREFYFSNVASLGLMCLLKALQARPDDEAVVQEILHADGCRAYVYHPGDGCRIIGAVLHARGTGALPAIKPLPRGGRRGRRQGSALQLDLFAVG